MLLKAFRIVVDNIAHMQLRIVGQGKEHDRLVGITAELGLQNNVRIFNYLGDAELAEQYCGATEFTLASRQEGLSIVYLEAMTYRWGGTRGNGLWWIR